MSNLRHPEQIRLVNRRNFPASPLLNHYNATLDALLRVKGLRLRSHPPLFVCMSVCPSCYALRLGLCRPCWLVTIVVATLVGTPPCLGWACFLIVRFRTHMASLLGVLHRTFDEKPLPHPPFVQKNDITGREFRLSAFTKQIRAHAQFSASPASNGRHTHQRLWT